MKRIVCVLFLLVSANAFAQNRYKIEPIFSLHYPLFPNSITFGGETFTDFQASFATRYSYSSGGYLNRSIGFQGEFPTSKIVSFRIGAAYAPKDFLAKWSGAPEAAVTGEVLFKQRYVDVPLSLRWYLVSKRLLVFLETGAVVNILTMSEAGYDKYDSYKPSFRDFKGFEISEFMIGVSAGLGVGYKLDDRVDLIFTTNYRQVLTQYTVTDTYRPRAIVGSVSLAIQFGEGSE